MKRLFVTTKNLDYIRNVQEIKLLGEPDIIGSRAGSYPGRLISVYWRLFTVNLKDYDEVFIGFAPQLVVPFFWWKLKRFKRHGRLKMDFFISMYDTLVCDRKSFREGSPAAGLLHRIDERTLAIADAVVVDTRAHGNYFVREFGVDMDKLEVLYLQADEGIYHPMERGMRTDTRKVVLYFGSILPLQGVDVVLDAIRLMENDPDYRFVMVGPIKDKDRVIADNVTYYEWLSQEELARSIADADICLAGHFNSNIEKAARTIPGKAYIYQAMERPMVLGDNPANRELFCETEGKIAFCEMGNARSLVEAIKRLG